MMQSILKGTRLNLLFEVDYHHRRLAVIVMLVPWHIASSLLPKILPQRGGLEGFFYSFNALLTGPTEQSKLVVKFAQQTTSLRRLVGSKYSELLGNYNFASNGVFVGSKKIAL